MDDHRNDIDPHSFLSILNNRLKSYIKANQVYDKAHTYSRDQLDSIIRSLVLDAATEVLNDHLNESDPHRIIDEIRKENAKIMNRVGVDPFYGAPVIIMVIALNVPTAVYDGSCVIDNIMNAAWSLGVGSCWIHRAKEEMESPFGKKLLEKLNLEGDYIGIGHVALGYIDGDVPNPKPRKENWIYKL